MSSENPLARPKVTHQQLVADYQKQRVMMRILRACSVVRSEIKASYISRTDNYDYHSGRKINESYILKRANVDKNTIKKPYHARLRSKVARFITWANKTLDHQHVGTTIESNGTPAIMWAFAERDEYAQRCGAMEFRVAELNILLESALEREAGNLIRIKELEIQIASYIKALVELNPKAVKLFQNFLTD